MSSEKRSGEEGCDLNSSREQELDIAGLGECLGRNQKVSLL